MIFAEDCLDGRLILVTGASSGLGRETALLLGRLGARLALAGRDEARLAEVAGQLGGTGHRVLSADLGDDATADELVTGLARDDGPLDGIFHSAGTSIVAPMRLTRKAQLESMFGAAVLGGLGLARAASRKGTMNDGGSIVFMSSVSALRGRKGMVGYSAAKAATSGLVRALAMELAERRIRVNAIAAGAVETQMHQDFARAVSPEMLENYRNLHPLGFGQPGDVANAAAFLLSDASRWITGIDLSVDGGYAAK